MPLALVLFAFGAGAQTKPRLIVLDLAPLDPEVSKAVSRQLTASLIKELGDNFVLVPESEIEGVRSGAEKPPDITAAITALAEAKDQLAIGQNKAAQRLIKTARAVLDPVRLRLRDYTPLTSMLLYSAVAAMNLGDKRSAQAAFNDLARLRPAFQINPAEFPPNVLEAFEKARSAEVKLPRGRLVLASTPVGARAFVDEVPVGNTPLTVPASPGEHVVRFESPGHLSWTKVIPVESYAKQEANASLEKNASSEALRKLEVDVLQGTPPGSLTVPASMVTAALNADALVIGIVGLSVKGYLASVAYLPAGAGPVTVSMVEIDRSMKDEKPALGRIATAMATASRAKGKQAKTSAGVLGDPTTRKIDFGKYALGLAPGGSAEVLADAERARAEALNFKGLGPAPEQTSSKWWIWVGAGVLVAAGGGTAAYFATRPGPQVQFEIQRQP